MSGQHLRQWTVVFQYPGKLRCWYGNAFVRREAPMHEVEEELWKELQKVLPDGCIKPPVFKPQPGSVWFVPETPNH